MEIVNISSIIAAQPGWKVVYENDKPEQVAVWGVVHTKSGEVKICGFVDDAVQGGLTPAESIDGFLEYAYQP